MPAPDSTMRPLHRTSVAAMAISGSARFSQRRGRGARLELPHQAASFTPLISRPMRWTVASAALSTPAIAALVHDRDAVGERRATPRDPR